MASSPARISPLRRSPRLEKTPERDLEMELEFSEMEVEMTPEQGFIHYGMYLSFIFQFFLNN
jgi:hypothetical protein